MMRYLVTLLFVVCSLSAEPATLLLQGHLDKEAVAIAQDRLQELQKQDPAEIFIQLNSSSGDLQAVLDLAKVIYTDKEENNRTLSLYIDESAIGPAAVLPFLADRLGSSLFVVWGDIPLGGDQTLPSNILRSRVRSLVPSNHPRAALLSDMAEAMADPQVTFDEGSAVAGEGETLVVDYKQLSKLSLISRHVVGLPSEKKGEAAGATEGVRTSLDEELAKQIRYLPNGPNKIGLIRIDDRTYGINQSTWIYVKAALDEYKETKPAFIILELNTPGGEVFASQKISDALKDMDTTHGIPVVAYINNWAISAGAMLAYSCRFIAIVKDASMGAAEPVFQGEQGEMKTASEKVNSALRTDFANRAGFFDRDPLLAQAMVDKDMLLVRRHGKIVKLDDEKEIRRTGLDLDEVITLPGKLLTLSAEEMMDLGVADFRVLPQRLDPISEEELAAGEWPASKSLLFTHPFFKKIPNATIDPVEMDWQLRFLAMLSVPAVASALFLGMMLGGYMELNSPGFGLPGIMALVCFSLIVLSSFAMEAASWLELIMVLIGVLLLALEIFVIPGFGIAGFLGILLTVGGLFALMLPGLGEVSYDVPAETFNAAGEEFILRLTWLCGTLVVGIVLIAVLARYVMPRMTLFSRLVHVGEETGYVAAVDATELPPVGSKGTVMGVLRPSGKVMIDGSIYEATTRGGFVDDGEEIEVISLSASHVVVKRVGDA